MRDEGRTRVDVSFLAHPSSLIPHPFLLNPFLLEDTPMRGFVVLQCATGRYWDGGGWTAWATHAVRFSPSSRYDPWFDCWELACALSVRSGAGCVPATVAGSEVGARQVEGSSGRAESDDEVACGATVEVDPDVDVAAASGNGLHAHPD